MKVEWILIADGIGQDSRGAVTAIAINQNVIIAPTLPDVAKRAVVAHITEAPGVIKRGDKINVSFRVISPSGDILAAQSGQVTVGQIIFPDLPVTTDLPMEFSMSLSEYGTHKIEIRVDLAGREHSEGAIELFVTEPPKAGSVNA